jgi:hypothetical protein
MFFSLGALLKTARLDIYRRAENKRKFSCFAVPEARHVPEEA